MKSFLRKFLVTVSLLSIITIQVEANTLTPPNVELLGNANGLVHIPEDDLFLHYPNMLPGDKVERTIDIKNKYEYPYEIFIRAKRVNPQEEYDLLNKLNLKITYKDKVIYAGPTSGEHELTDNISLGVFKPGQEEKLVAVVELDGPSTGNEYKNKHAQVNWLFTAARYEKQRTHSTEKPDTDLDASEDGKSNFETTPKTGDDGIIKYAILAGASLILLLFRTRKKDS